MFAMSLVAILMLGAAVPTCALTRFVAFARSSTARRGTPKKFWRATVSVNAAQQRIKLTSPPNHAFANGRPAPALLICI